MLKMFNSKNTYNLGIFFSSVGDNGSMVTVIQVASMID